MSIELVQNTQQEPQNSPPQQQINQPNPQPQQIVPEDFTFQQAPQVQQPQQVQAPTLPPVTQYVAPPNMATKEDVAFALQLSQKTALDTALYKFQNEHKDHVDVKAEMLQILDKNPGLWETGYENALEFAYAKAKNAKIIEGTNNLLQQTATMNQQIQQTAANIQQTQNIPTNTNPLNHTPDTESDEDYGKKLIAMSQSSFLF